MEEHYVFVPDRHYAFDPEKSYRVLGEEYGRYLVMDDWNRVHALRSPDDCILSVRLNVSRRSFE